MRLFEHLMKLREVERTAFPRALSLVERDICLLIGLYNERGASVTLKDIRSRDIAPQATLERALGRLVAEGIVQKSSSYSDGRCREFKLDAIITRKLRRFNLGSWIANFQHDE